MRGRERAEQGAAARELGLGSLFALGVNGIVGVGIFFTPNLVAAIVPGHVGTWAYALTAALLVPVAVVYGTLGARFDRDGGPTVWAHAAYGPLAGFLVGLIAYCSAVFSTAAVIAGLGEYTAPLLGVTGELMRRGFALSALLGFALLVMTGLKPSAWLWSALTVLKLLPLFALLLAFSTHSGAAQAADAGATRSGGLLRAALVIVFPLQGFEIVPVPASRVRSRLAVPLATLGSLLFAALLYVALHEACLSALPDLTRAKSPLVEAARQMGGRSLGELVSLGTNVSVIGIAFGMLVMTPRYLAALAGREVLGPWLREETASHVPLRALWVTALLVSVLVASHTLSHLFVLSSIAVLTQYAVSALSLARLAFTRQHGLLRRHALAAPLALCAVLLLVLSAERAELATMAGLIAFGLLLWFVRKARS
ncbi:MAG TPA: APC family permease [Polyangiaceae bacterium]